LPSDPAIANETSGIIQSPIHNYTSFGQYNVQLTAISDFGCEDSYEKTIIVEEDHRVYVPNSFTPDGDGINDVFKAEGSTIQSKNFSMVIYNRLGEVIFESFDINEGWDGNYKNGNKATPQVYVFMVSYYSGDRFYEKNGTVTLLR
jgi:gliding motility-associated-like protein